MQGLLKETSSTNGSRCPVARLNCIDPVTITFSPPNRPKTAGVLVHLGFCLCRSSANAGEEVSMRVLLSAVTVGAPTHLPHHQPHRCNSCAAGSLVSKPIIHTTLVAPRAFAVPVLRVESSSTFLSVFRCLRVTGLSTSPELTRLST